MAHDGLNVLGRVPWEINKPVLEIARQCWRSGIAIGDIPSSNDFDVPPAPIKLDRIPDEVFADRESEGFKSQVIEFKAYNDALKRHNRMKQKNMDLRSLRCSAILKLDQAEMFQDFEKMYFPYNMDFRGRAYPVPPHLSNVGSDLCRGMLSFAEKKKLGPRGFYWLKVHLANLAGNDKITFEERATFTDENMENVRAAVEDPFGENRWWMSLDDPFQGLATCYEIIRAIDSGDPENYECSLPVHMDGSCNGLQHYAALGRDSIGGKAVNLCKEDRPQDVYSGVMEEVVRQVAAEAALDLDIDETREDLSKTERDALKSNRAAKLVNGLIDRGVVKRTVMTSVYGVTYIGARKQIQEKIEEKLENQGVDVHELDHEVHAASGYLATKTMDVMGQLFSGARQTMNWLTACARLIAEQGQPVAFISPIGIPVVQPYRQSKSHTVVTLLQTVTLADNSDDLPVHKQRQVTAFPPNYVHSLDSSHMLLTALEMDRRGLSFSAVHDSFWTHPCDIDEMNQALRDTFVELYEQPLLEDLKKTWELRYPSIQFPDLPERGNLNLGDVRSAPYFFQ
jgi:DNA-directed RNA polymerase